MHMDKFVGHCSFATHTAGTICTNGCGYRLPHDCVPPIYRNCPAYKPRLGDVTKRLLEKGNITPELVAKIVSVITLGAKQPDEKQGCGGCNKRQQWLNLWPAPHWLAALAGIQGVKN